MTTPVGKYGLTKDGWIGKSLDQIAAEVDAALQGILGKTAGSNPDGSIPLNTKAGQTKTLIVDLIAELWDLLAAIVAALDPAQATGVAQDNLAALTGTIREGADFSSVLETCCGTVGTVLQPGRIVSVGVGGATFTSLFQGAVAATIAQLSQWTTSLSVLALGTRLWNNDGSSNPHAWQATGGTFPATTAGSGAGPVPPVQAISFDGSSLTLPAGSLAALTLATAISGLGVTASASGDDVTITGPVNIQGNRTLLKLLGLNPGAVSTTVTITGPWVVPTAPSTPGDTAYDNGVVWTLIGDGQGAVDVEMQASAVGPTAAPAGTLNNIQTPVFGWDTAYNVEDAVIGQLQETDAAFRIRRDQELQSEGLGTVGAIRAEVLRVGQGTTSFVTACSVFENTSDTTGPDDTGIITADMPPHSILVIADYPGAGLNADLENQIAKAIFTAKGAGIQTTWANAPSGAQKTGSAFDSEGNEHTVLWARPALTRVNVAVTVTYDSTNPATPIVSDIQKMVQGGVLSNGTTTPGILPALSTTYPAGKDVWASPLEGAIMYGVPDSTETPTIPGLLDAECLIALNPVSPISRDHVQITNFQRMTIESGDVSVACDTGTP